MHPQRSADKIKAACHSGKTATCCRYQRQRHSISMDIQLLVVKLFRRLPGVGLRATLRDGLGLLRRGRTTDEFDLRQGTDTGGTLPLWRLKKISSPNARFGTAYQTIEEQATVDAMRALRDDPHVLTFIDLGCGKGRVLLVAANFGFKQVIGVEFSHELAEIAKKNLRKMGIANAAVVQTDAAKYRFPDSDMVVYLFNPFSEEVMQTVISNLRESLAKKIYVIYVNPRCARLFDNSGFLTRLGCPPARPGIQIWSASTPSQETNVFPATHF